MVVYIEMDGNVKILSPENIYQGSTTNRVTLITPFPSTTAVSVGFILPDGTTVTDSSGSNYFPMELLNTETSAGVTSTAYEYVLPFTVLEQYGELKIAFKATFTNGNQTSYLATVEVQESILPTPPENPDEDTYQLLLQYIQTAMQNAANAQSAAEAAQTAAESAETKAAAAETTAGQANETANEAKTTADGIDGKATQALSISEKAVTTANEAKELAEQAVAGAGTEVYVNNDLQSRLDFTADPQTQINDKQTQIDNIENGTTQVGSAAQADKLAQARNLKVDLASSEAQSFDGSADATEIGVKGILPVANGGTGATDLANITVGRATADANDNVIDTTYAKLTQVVRTDAAQSLTDDEKTRAKDNLVIQTTKNYSGGTTKGWYRVAKLDRQTVYSVTIGQAYNYIPPMNVKLALNLGYQEAIITQESGILPGGLPIDRVRVCIGTTADAFFDVHIFNANFNTTKISIDRLYNSDGAVAIETYDDWEYLGTDDTVTGYNVTRLDLVSGTNTSGQVYQQGSPVLVGSAPSWVTGTSGSLTLPSAGWYIVGIFDNTASGWMNSTVFFYWNGTDSLFQPLVRTRAGTTGALRIEPSGTMRTEEDASGTNISNKLSYYKLA